MDIQSHLCCPPPNLLKVYTSTSAALWNLINLLYDTAIHLEYNIEIGLQLWSDSSYND